MDMRIEQALLGRESDILSPGFRSDCLNEGRRLHAAFGALAEATFAQPLGRGVVAVVRIRADQAHVLAVSTSLYKALEGDLFALSGSFPVDWEARELVTLEWTRGQLPARTVSGLSRILNTTADRSAALLGGAQALLDGGRVVFERTGPEDGIVADLWSLLPSAARAEMWPATFARDNALGFHVLAVPSVVGPMYEGYLRETEASEYPEGRYELDLQIAVEAGDQPELDRLLARRSRSEMVRLAIFLLVLVTIAAVLSRVQLFRAAPTDPPAPQLKEK